MKKTLRRIVIIIILVTGPLFMFQGFSESGPTVPGGSPLGGQGGPVGSSAPIDGGLSILLTLSAAYSLKRTWQMKKPKNCKRS